MVMQLYAPLTHVLSPSALPVLLDVICHQKLNFLLAPVQSFHPVCHHSNFSHHRSLEQRNPSIMHGFRSKIHFALNLCMSLWFCCSHTAVQRKRTTQRIKKINVVSGDIEGQVDLTAAAGSTELKCFPFQLLREVKTWTWRVKTQVQYSHKQRLQMTLHTTLDTTQVSNSFLWDDMAIVYELTDFQLIVCTLAEGLIKYLT